MAMNDAADMIYPYVKILSWPVTAVLIVWFIRKEIALLLGSVRSLQVGSITVTLSETVKKTGNEIQALYTKHKTAIKGSSGPDVYRKKIALITGTSPLAVIPFAYEQIEYAVTSIALPMRPANTASRTAINEVVKMLYDSDSIDEENYRLFTQMQRIHDTILCNKITAIKKSDCVKYGKAAGMLIDIIISFWEP
jgi:hypothetical protein